MSARPHRLARAVLRRPRSFAALPLLPLALAVVLAALLAVAVAPTPAAAQAAGSGGVTGQVLEEASDRPLPGARVRVEGTNLSATTDLDGRYRLIGVPAGPRTVVVSYLGFETARVEVTVEPGRTVTGDAALVLSSAFGDTVDVTSAPILEGQAKALNQQRTAVNIQNIVAADQIGSFPDPNAAEATQRIPGVSIERDQGEGRYVLIRGTEARLNSMMINGERLPSPEGDVRQVALDVIPADLLASIEVSKALTPDMDGDAIGGAVNLVTRTAPETERLTLSGGLGHNDLTDDGIETAAVTWGRRFADGRHGLLLGGSYMNTDRGSDNFEPAYDDGELAELQLRDYEVNRERLGLNAAWDLRRDDASGSGWVRGVFNEFDDQEFRRVLNNVVEDDELVRELRDRFESQQIWRLSAGGERLLGGGEWLLEARASTSYAEEDEPRAVETVFVQEDVAFDPNVSPDSIDPDDIRANPLDEDIGAFVLDEVIDEDNLTTEEDVTAAVDVSRYFYRDEGLSGTVQGGLKVRFKTKDQDVEAFELSPEDDIFLTDFLDPDYDGGNLIDGRYDLGPFFGTGTGADLIASGALEREKDREEDAGDFEVDEDVYAAYAMTELELGDRTTVLGGVRYERTEIDTLGFRVLFDDEGDFAALETVEGSNSYGELLPSLHWVYRVDEDSNLRAAVTRSLARPDYESLTPREIILEEDGEIERGNPDLDVTTAWNLDLLYERYLASVGVVQAGVFYKELSDYVYLFRFDELRGGEEFEVIQPLNGDSAELWGLELAFQNRLAFLPEPFDGLGVYLNYTWTDSSARFPDREGEEATLPGQSESLGNLALSYEKAGFSGRLSLNYHGSYIAEVGETPAEDIFYDDHLQLDFSASQRLTPELGLYLELINLTDEPLRFYQGTSDRPIQEEYYSWWGTLGLKWNP